MFATTSARSLLAIVLAMLTVAALLLMTSEAKDPRSASPQPSKAGLLVDQSHSGPAAPQQSSGDAASRGP